MSPKICRCHGVAMGRNRHHYYCLIRFRAANRLRAAVYRRTAKGQASTKAANARRVYIGTRAVTHARTPALAQTINTYVRSAVRAFVHRPQEDAARASQ